MKGLHWLTKLNPVDALAKRAGRKAVEGALDAITPKETSVNVKNWKTSLGGIVGVAAIVVKVINGGSLGGEDIAIISGLIGLLFAKDKDVTGIGASATRQE